MLDAKCSFQYKYFLYGYLNAYKYFESAEAPLQEVAFPSKLIASDVKLVKWFCHESTFFKTYPSFTLGEDASRVCKKFWKMTGGVRPNQWMQMPSMQQPRVPVCLQTPGMCETNPQDLVCFPPHLLWALYSSPHLPCLLAASVFPLRWIQFLHIWLLCSYSCHHDLPLIHLDFKQFDC